MFGEAQLKKGVVSSGQPQQQDRGQPWSVLHALPVQVYAVQYFDGQGRLTDGFVFEVNGTLYMEKSNDATKNMVQVRDSLAKNTLVAIAKAKPVELPDKDAVDVLK